MLLSLGPVKFMSHDLEGLELELARTSYLCTLEGCAAKVDLVSTGCTTWLLEGRWDHPPSIESDDL